MITTVSPKPKKNQSSEISQISSLTTKSDIFDCPGQCWTPGSQQIDRYQPEAEESSLQKGSSSGGSTFYTVTT